MILFFEAKSVSKELRARGRLTARTKVRRGLYDVIVGDSRFRSLQVIEPHINSSAPQRVLMIECGPDAFDLEYAIRNWLKASMNTISFSAIGNQGADGGRPSNQFDLVVSSLYTYVTLQGSLSERPPTPSEGFCWMLVQHAGHDASETEFSHVAVRAFVTSEDPDPFHPKNGTQNEIVIPIALGGVGGQFKICGDQTEMMFADHAVLADQTGSLLTAGHRCLIPFAVEKRPFNQDQAPSTAVATDWEKVGF